jgi:nicotinate-nucleotide pyrophosphorylase (carboxylating)
MCIYGWDKFHSICDEICPSPHPPFSRCGRVSQFFFQRGSAFGHPSGMDDLSAEEIRRAVRLALDEDIGTGDVTTLSTIPEQVSAQGVIVAREPCAIAGIALAEAAFVELSPAVRMERQLQDGTWAKKGARVLTIAGPARALLTAERVALNFLQRLSGVATLTRRFVQAIEGTQARILDTRKTTPGWRRFEKYAVRCGGGQNHRLGLFDMALVKDNHLVCLRNEPPHPIGAAVRRIRDRWPHRQLRIEVEADTPQQVQHALEAGADIILLDNMTVDELRTAVHWVNQRAKTEASGGITLQNVRAMAETGVDFISVGALTHSAPAVDLALDFEW